MAGHNTAAVITKLTVQRASRDSILLMHDIHLWTVDTAAPTIDTLQKQGYTLVTVSQLLGSTKPGSSTRRPDAPVDWPGAVGARAPPPREVTPISCVRAR